MLQKMVAQRFQIEMLIGGGAVGSVYQGTDTQTGEQVAIKVLRKELTADMPELIERFRREGEALRRLNHPNIVKMLAMIEEEGQHYLVMEYVVGGSLAGLLKRQPQLPLIQVVSIALELSDALARAHHLEILHRDIKPGNILLAADGTPRLTDFGLARLGNYPAITATGSVLVTFQYLSPEAFYNQDLDSRADIWSLGVVLYEMLAGRVPFGGGTPGEILWAINNQPLPDPSWQREDIPLALVELPKKMLMRDRPLRIASARQVGAELEMIQNKLPRLPETQQAGTNAVQVESPPAAAFGEQPPSSKKIRSPVRTLRPGRTSASQRSGPSRRTSSTSIVASRNPRRPRRPGASEPTPARWPKSRAGITRVLFTTSSSSPRTRSGSSRNTPSSQERARRSSSSMREASRSASGASAMRSGGSV